MKIFSCCLLFLGCIVTLLPRAAHSQDSPDPKVVDAARREGEIVWYTTMSSDQSNVFMERFQRKYPFLKPSVVRIGGSALLNRILAEAKAGKHYADVVHGTGEIVLPLMNLGLLAPYVSPESKMFPDDLKDKKGFWTSVYVNSVVLGYNVNLTKGQAIPRSYAELLQPKWKGRKISVDDTYATFLQGLISVWGKDKAVEYLKKLADQDPVVVRGTTVRVQLAAAGEFPLVIGYANIIQNLAEKGAPIDWVALEPAVVSVNTVMVAAKGAHPTRQDYSSTSLCPKRARRNYGIFKEFLHGPMSNPSRRNYFAVTSATSCILKSTRTSMKSPGFTRRSSKRASEL